MYKKALITMFVALAFGLLLGVVVQANNPQPKPGTQIQIPRIDVGEGIDGWSTWIQTVNTGVATDEDTGVVAFFWGDYSEECPPNDPGPIGHACMPIPPQGTWTLRGGIPTEAKSAILYSVSPENFDLACQLANYKALPRFSEEPAENWREWAEDWQSPGGQIDQGQPLVATVWRRGPDDFGTYVSSTYNGITPGSGGPPYQYFAPYAMLHYHNLETEMTIQNSGTLCTSVWVYYMREGGDCSPDLARHIETLAPGEAIRERVPEALGNDWLGSAYISANEPLGIIVDESSFAESGPPGRGVDLASQAPPYAGSTSRIYAGLIFRTWNGGWSASIQVQNMTRGSLPTYVTVDFLDDKGGEILFLGDWVCPYGATTFYLPAITDLGVNMIGQAVIEAHNQVDYPHNNVVEAQPIFAWVDLNRPPDLKGSRQGASYEAQAEDEFGGMAVAPWVAKQYPVGGSAVTTLLAVSNHSSCVRNEVQLDFVDTGGAVIYQISRWLEPWKMWLVDLNNINGLIPGWTGSLWARTVNEQQLCDVNGDGFVDPQPPRIGGVVVTYDPDGLEDTATATETWNIP